MVASVSSVKAQRYVLPPFAPDAALYINGGGSVKRIDIERDGSTIAGISNMVVKVFLLFPITLPYAHFRWLQLSLSHQMETLRSCDATSIEYQSPGQWSA